MAQSFLNPSQFAPRVPEYSGFLGGIVRGNRNDDYEKLLADQLELQRMGLEDTRIDLSEKQADLPIKALEREGKEVTLRAKRPFLEKLAVGEAEDKLGEFESKKEKRPLELRQLIAEVTGKEKDMDWQKRIREATMMKEFIPQAKALGGERGAAWMREQIKKAKAIGYDLPDELANPTEWGRYEKGLVNTIEHLRQLEIEAAKDATERELGYARINAENARHKQTLEQGGKRERYTGSNPIPVALRILKDKKSTPEDIEEAKSVLTYAIRENAVKQAKQTVGAALESSPESNKLSTNQIMQMIQREATRIETQYRQELGLPTTDPLAASGQIRQPGQPAKSQDGWGIRQIP